MIEEIGVISAVEHHQNQQVVWIETQIKSTCGSCEAQSNCGTGSIARALANKREKLRFQINEAVSVGQKVKLGIPEQSLLKASALVYIVPLLVLTVSALLAQILLPEIGLQGEGGVILLSAVMTIIAFKVVSRYLHQAKDMQYHPQILSVLPKDIEQIGVKQL